MFNEKLPKYCILKRDIIQKIESGEYREGMLIASERELIEQYQFSRITIRKAIDELVNEGYLYRIQGKGTYIKGDAADQNLFCLNSCTEDVKRLGRTPSKKTVKQEKIPVDTKRAKYLDISLGDMVHMIGRITYADQEPLNYTVTYLPEKLFPGLEGYDLEKRSLYDIVENDYKVQITKARRTIEAVLPDSVIAGYLEISAMMPVIRFNCITYGQVSGKEIPIESFVCYYRTDHYKFYIDQVN
ncbi:MAG: GntR family transcriptional regulator [Lachnospiraceae bacterium]|nr:GntR family transcriptional regulator [Lachnospiraceae bacterium]